MPVIGSTRLLIALALVFAWGHAANAFDFVDSLRVYDEDYEAETSFPLSPESNELGASGLSYFVDPVSASSTLTGSSLQVSLATVLRDDDWISVGTVSSEVPPDAIGFDNYGVRGHFENATSAPDATVHFSVGVYFDPGTAPRFIGFQLALVDSGPDLQGIIRLLEVGPSFGLTEIPVSAGLTAAILAGGSFTLDLAIERTLPRAEIRLEVSGSPPFATTVPLGETASLEPFGIYQNAQVYDDFNPSSASVEFTRFEVFVSPLLFVVDTTSDEVDASIGDGFCATAEGFCSLRAAIQESNALPGRSEIQVPVGAYVLSRAGAGEDLASTGDLDILDDVVLTGAGRGSTIIDAGGIDRVFEIHYVDGSTSVRLSDVTIRNGSARTAAGATGGAIANSGQLTLARCAIEDSEANLAGGIMNHLALEMDDCVVSGNEAVDFGFGNTRVGGIASASTSGGGINPTAWIRNSAIVENFAPSLGGIEFGNCASAQVENSTISGNSGTQIEIFNCDTYLRHVTVTSASGLALSAGSFAGNDKVEFANSAFEGAPACSLSTSFPASLSYSGSNASSDASCGFVGAGDVVGIPLGLGPLADLMGSRVRVPGPGSPLIDAADLVFCPSNDQIGTSRPLDGDGDGTPACDIGAIEVPEPNALTLLSAGLFALQRIDARRRRCRRR